MINSSQWILTPCGTSVLTNGATQKIKDTIFKYANNIDVSEMIESDKSELITYIDQRTNSLLEMNESEASRASAELNAINKFARISNKETTHHCLLPTDTWMGKQTAKMISKWLNNHSSTTNCEVLEITGIQTKDFSNFQLSLSDLSVAIIERTKALKEQNTYIAFNLTGGFKSISGFLQVLATTLADESFYIFEGSSDLLRIPKLPMEFTTDAVFTRHLQTFRRLALGLSVTANECSEIPETLIYIDEAESMLSGLGQLQWDAIKGKLYRASILAPPSQKIELTANFKSSAKALDSSRVYEVNKRMDELAYYLEAPNKGSVHNPKTLNFKEFKTKKGTYQLNAWSDRDARRIYGHYKEDRSFLIESLQKHS